MFFSSVLVPKVDSPTGRIETLASQRSEPSSMFTSETPVAGERDVVLGDLVALGQVGIEVVLAVEDRPRGQVALERQRDHQREVHGLGVGGRKRAGVAEADRARARVGLLAERQRAAA